MYRESLYNFIYDEKDRVVIYNSYSNAIVVLTSFEFNHLKSYLNNEISEDDFIYQLVRLGVLIEENKNEKSNLNSMRIKGAKQTNNLFFRILPTTDCNARCFYCYEAGVDHCAIDKKIFPKIIGFIESCIKEDTKRINIQWYGGEPLLELEAIQSLTKGLKELFKKKNLKYSFTMISNGILLDSKTVLILANELEIKKIQITLDGMSEEYKKRKAYINNFFDPFETIVNNIDSLLNVGINVDIRLNCDGLNYSSILNLIDFLSIRFKHFNNLNVYAFPLYGSYWTKTESAPNSQYITTKQFSAIIRKLIDKKLMKIPSLRIKRNSCGATNFNSYAILPNGNLLKCMMNTSDVVGNVITGVDYNRNYCKWCSIELPKECEDCKFLPLCEGGCRAGHLGYSGMSCFVYKDIIKDLVDILINSLQII